jgi:hypothetical protein
MLKVMLFSGIAMICGCASIYHLAAQERPKPPLPTYEQGYEAGYRAAIGNWRKAGICTYANLACKIEVR